ncbi:MAG: hypothetical protein GXY83_23070 [Rhodopirellula sp.]|nr:hypothetical protein [Rhodopirellula sp.]
MPTAVGIVEIGLRHEHRLADRRFFPLQGGDGLLDGRHSSVSIRLARASLISARSMRSLASSARPSFTSRLRVLTCQFEPNLMP